jgi:hypothetical protein
MSAIPVSARKVSRQPAATLVLASLGVFMTALDTLVVTTALPVLRVGLAVAPLDARRLAESFGPRPRLDRRPSGSTTPSTRSA